MNRESTLLKIASNVYGDSKALELSPDEVARLGTDGIRQIPSIGFLADVYKIQATGEVVVAFAGTRGTFPSLVNVTGIPGANLPDQQLAAAEALIRAVAAEHGPVTLIGHSAGGVTAQLIAVREQLVNPNGPLPITEAWGFNSPGVAPFLPQIFGSTPIPETFTNVHSLGDLRDPFFRWHDTSGAGAVVGDSQIGTIHLVNAVHDPSPGYGWAFFNPFTLPENIDAVIKYHPIARLREHHERWLSTPPPFPEETEVAFSGPTGLDVLTAMTSVNGAPLEEGADEFDVLQTSSPIALDLDGDGVGTQGLLAGAFFDHAGDGFAELTGWIGPDDALLVRDINGDGAVDRGGELFGNETMLPDGTRALDGYQALAHLDRNADGRIDVTDPIWSELRVWRDADGNGSSRTSELHTLAAVGVSAIATSATPSAFVDANGNEHRLVSTFTRADGSEGETADVWFRVTRRYGVTGAILPVPGEVAMLPDIVGHGTVRGLHQAIVRDGSGMLRALVEQFIAEPDPAGRNALIEPLLFTWTGTDGIDPASRGPHIDARRLATLERVYGEAFTGIEGTGNPNAEVGGILNHTFQGFAELSYAQLMTQTHLRELWMSAIYSWDVAADRLRGDLSAVTEELQGLLGADAQAGRIALGEFARTVRGLGVEPLMDFRTFRDTFAAQGEELAWIVDSGGKALLAGTAASDILTAGATADALLGGDGDDVLFGDEGDDVLYGQAGADTLIGGADADLLDGGSGSDVLDGRRGNDRLLGRAGNDQLVGDAGDDVLEGGEGADHLDGGEGDDVLIGGAGADVLLGREHDDVLLGGDADDYLNGNRGADTLAGEAGNDVLMGEGGEDVLDGGAGDDHLDGGTESDRYRLAPGSGHDTIVDRDANPGNTDVIALADGIAPEDVRVRRAGDDLLLDVTTTGDQVRVVSWFSETAPRQFEIEEVRFAGSVLWDRQAIRQMVTIPTEGPDHLVGYETDDALVGLGGDDTLAGRAGDDLLDGGAGSDVLEGNEGHDTLQGGPGDDSLRGHEGQDILRGGDGNDWLGGDRDDDVLAGDEGHDVLDGGGGIDRLDGGPGDDDLAGGDGADVLDGGPGNDALRGDEGDDLLRGGPGVDSLRSNAGNDALYGGDGDDVLAGDRDSDVLVGEAGHDRLDGGPGIDAMAGGPGDDTYIVDDLADTVAEALDEGIDTIEASIAFTLPSHVEHLTLTGGEAVAGAGNALSNRLTGNASANVLAGGAGDDILDGGGEADSLLGGPGHDTYVIAEASVIAIELAGEGTDVVRTSVTYSLPAHVEDLVLTGIAPIAGIGNASNNRLTGNSAANLLDGGSGDDVLEAGGGNDTLVGGPGMDTLAGGPGDDTYVADGSDAVTEGAGEGADGVEAGVSYVLPANVESLTLTGTAAIDGTGNELNNRLTGNAGANTLAGGARDDILAGGPGGDRLIGGAGNDTYVLTDAGDVVVEAGNQGVDTVESAVTYALPTYIERLVLTGSAAVDGTGNAASNVLIGNGAANRLNGGAGIDVLIGGAGDDTYVVDSAAETVTEAAGEGTDTVEADVAYVLPAHVERLTLIGSGAVNATGNALNNVLTGNGKNNVLDGEAGADVMTGGAGHDTYVIDDVGDVVVEASGAGTDTVESAITYTLPDNVEKLVLTGSAAIDGFGNALNNTLTGNGGANRLDGAAGADTMAGGAGNDTYVVDRATDTVQESANAGTDTVVSSVTYALPANVENLTLTGGQTVGATGNALANVIRGNPADNALDGRAGNDTYLFGRGSGRDTIQDNDTTPGNTDTLALADLDPLDLVIGRLGATLRIAVHGSSDRVDISAWYNGPANHVEAFRAGDGSRLLSTQVDQLIQAMASYSTQSGLSWDQAVDQRPDEVEAILAAHWQPAAS